MMATHTDRVTLIRQLVDEAEFRRVKADYNTGSIEPAEALELMDLAERITARVVIEVGTFIGLSATALASASCVDVVYTCDCSNDCLPNDTKIRTYPKTSSTQMFRELVARKVRADLCFFDGVLSQYDADVLLNALTHQGTVYAVHDYSYGPKVRRRKDGTTYLETMPRKGIGNVNLLAPRLTGHQLVKPAPGTTLAMLVPVVRP
jgi:predicted O-methyltransferase YrrM